MSCLPFLRSLDDGVKQIWRELPHLPGFPAQLSQRCMQDVRVRNLIPSNIVKLDEDITNVFFIESYSFLLVPQEQNCPLLSMSSPNGDLHGGWEEVNMSLREL
jgi:hypothetical protein